MFCGFMSCGYTDSTVSTSVISGLLFHDSVSTTIMKAVSELEVMHGMRFAYIHETDRKFTFLVQPVSQTVYRKSNLL